MLKIHVSNTSNKTDYFMTILEPESQNMSKQQSLKSQQTDKCVNDILYIVQGQNCIVLTELQSLYLHILTHIEIVPFLSVLSSS